MKQQGLITTFLIACCIFLSSCKCPDKQCAGFSSDWVPFGKGNILKFINANGQKVSFIIVDYNATEPENIKCNRENHSCVCEECNSGGATISGSTEDTIGFFFDTIANRKYNYNRLEITIGRNQSSPYYLVLRIFDFSKGIKLESPLEITGNDTLFPSLTLGSTVFSDVIALNSNGSNLVSKIYYNKQYGFLGFYHLNTHSLFCREL